MHFRTATHLCEPLGQNRAVLSVHHSLFLLDGCQAGEDQELALPEAQHLVLAPPGYLGALSHGIPGGPSLGARLSPDRLLACEEMFAGAQRHPEVPVLEVGQDLHEQLIGELLEGGTDLGLEQAACDHHLGLFLLNRMMGFCLMATQTL